jgi:hypothetical protein
LQFSVIILAKSKYSDLLPKATKVRAVHQRNRPTFA